MIHMIGSSRAPTQSLAEWTFRYWNVRACVRSYDTPGGLETRRTGTNSREGRLGTTEKKTRSKNNHSQRRTTKMIACPRLDPNFSVFCKGFNQFPCLDSSTEMSILWWSSAGPNHVWFSSWNANIYHSNSLLRADLNLLYPRNPSGTHPNTLIFFNKKNHHYFPKITIFFLKLPSRPPELLKPSVLHNTSKFKRNNHITVSDKNIIMTATSHFHRWANQLR